MNRIQQLYNITMEMVSVLDNAEKEESDRDEIIIKINLLIQQRDEIMTHIYPPYTDDEIRIGKKVVTLNDEIKVKMNNLYDRIKDDLKKIKQKRQLNRSYINPYGQIKSIDGMYLDSKQ